MKKYYASRTLFDFVAFLAWCSIAAGCIAAVIGGGLLESASSTLGRPPVRGLSALVGSIPGAAVAFSGFLFLVFVQTGRAAIDTAAMTSEMLVIAREGLKLQKAADARAAALPAATPTNAPAPPRSAPSLAAGDRPGTRPHQTLGGRDRLPDAEPDAYPLPRDASEPPRLDAAAPLQPAPAQTKKPRGVRLRR